MSVHLYENKGCPPSNLPSKDYLRQLHACLAALEKAECLAHGESKLDLQRAMANVLKELDRIEK